MIRSLFLMLALLSPGLAFGANPSAPFSDQVVPAGPPGSIACDIGPNASSVPVPAQKAGFTHCVLNADFTSASFSNPATYIEECGASPTSLNTLFHIQFNNQEASQIGDAPCSQASITTDSGVQVLHLQYLPSNKNSGWDLLSFNWPASPWASGPCINNNLCAGGPHGMGLGDLTYVETVWRAAPSSFAITTTDFQALDFWKDGCNGCPGVGGYSTADPEVDFFEIHANSYNGTTATLDGAVTFTAPVTQYHTYGTLTTGNGNTFAQCAYLDGVRQTDLNTGDTCYTRSQSTFQLGKEIDWWLGGNSCYGNPPCESQPVDLYLQRISVWACAGNWGTGANTQDPCNPGTLITSENKNEPWYKPLISWLMESLISSARAFDVFDPPAQGWWKCADGHFDYPHQCMPESFKGIEWWKACVPGRSDCVHSDNAFIGTDYARGRAMRGPGYCYTQEPYTCSPQGRVPQ